MISLPLPQRVHYGTEHPEIVDPPQGLSRRDPLEVIRQTATGPRNRQCEQGLAVLDAAHQSHPAGRHAGIERERLSPQRMMGVRDDNVVRSSRQFRITCIREPLTW